MLYRLFIRPVLFLFDPESVHYFVVSLLKFAYKVPGIERVVASYYSVYDEILEKTVFGLKFKNPVGLAAGFDKNAEFYNELSAFGFSFIEIGTVTPRSQPGNNRPRSFRLPDDNALINRMGINNDGAGAIAARLRKTSPNVIIGGNISKNTLTVNSNAIDDYKYCFEVLYDVVDYFVLNVSCPNVGDIRELQDADNLLETLRLLKEISAMKSVQKPLLLKISPDLSFSQLDELIDMAFKTGIDGFVATNTTVKREGLATDRTRIEEIGKGGLSGKPLRERSTEIIRYLVQKSGGRIPVIGAGGIIDAEDAIEKLKAGASLVQVYTGFIYTGPSIVSRINKAIINDLRN
jgi:dihydroorotate dehydrogenase